MRLREIIERLRKELERCGDYEVSDIAVPSSGGGEAIALFY